MSISGKDLESSLNDLSVSQKAHKSSKSSSSMAKKTPVADSWEDEETASSSDPDVPLSAQQSLTYPAAPPPTPITPMSPYIAANTERNALPATFTNPYSETWSSDPRGARNADTRPEKTDAVAKRLIAGALGVRAPKKTEEQKAYDRAVREKEMKRINGEKEAKIRAEEEARKAKAAAWDD